MTAPYLGGGFAESNPQGQIQIGEIEKITKKRKKERGKEEKEEKKKDRK